MQQKTKNCAKIAELLNNDIKVPKLNENRIKINKNSDKISKIIKIKQSREIKYESKLKNIVKQIFIKEQENN